MASLVQDKRGFIWVGTQGGLHRYNGYEFDVFEYEPFVENSISSNTIQTLHYDPIEDVLWIGTYQGLNKMDLPSANIQVYANDESDSKSLVHNVVVTVLRDSKGRLWVGTLGGLNRLLADESGFHRYPVNNEAGNIRSATIRKVLEDSEGRIWVVSNGGVYLYNETDDSFSLVVAAELGNSLSDLGMVGLESPDGRLHFGFWDGAIEIFDTKSLEHLGRIEIEDRRIYSLLMDQFENLWIGTWGGGLYFRDAQTQTISSHRSQRGVQGAISGDIVYSILEDRTGIVWVGTHGEGLDRYNPLSRAFEQMTHNPENPQTLSAGSVTRIAKDTDGRYLVGTYNGGLNIVEEFDGSVRRFLHEPGNTEGISNDIIRDILVHPDGNIWIGTNNFLNRLGSDGSFQWYRTNDLDGDLGLKDHIIMSLLAHEDPDLLWIGSYDHGLFSWGPQRGVVEELELPSALVYTLVRDPQGRIWIGTNQSLSMYDGAQLRSLRYDGTRSGLSGNSVRAIEIDQDGNVWAGTVEGGITVVNPNMEILRHITKVDGLLSNTIVALRMDKAGLIWAATNAGINQVSLEQGVLRVLSREHGLASDEFSSGSFLDEDGQLIFGNVGGLTRFDPTVVVGSRRLIPPIVTEVQVGNETRYLDGNPEVIAEIEVPWTANAVLFEFSTLNYSTAEDNRYAYRLDGFEEDWHLGSETHRVSYTNLPPGCYVFQVSTGVISPDGELPLNSQVSLRVQAPPHLRWWAYVLYAAAALVIIYSFTQLRVSRALSSQVKTLESVKKDLEAANRKLNYLSYHDVLSSLGNRRLFTDTLLREWTRCRRAQEPLSLISVDIDFFKRYNDSLGHPAGDRVLKEVAEILRESTSRSTDLACRVGGEEFTLILPATPMEGALKIAKDIMLAMERKKIHHPDSSVGHFLTLSIGVGAMVPDHRDAQFLVHLCDQALYKAKHQGRNQIVLADTDSLG